MQNVFIGSWSWSEHKVCAYQSTVVYNFFEQNGYTLISSPINADIIVLNGYPFEEFEEKINLLTINYYLVRYPNANIVLIGSIPAMMPYLQGISRIQMIWLKEKDKFDALFMRSISIHNIEVDTLRFFIPLNIESLNIDKYWYLDANIESRYIFSQEDLSIDFDAIQAWNYPIDRISEYNTEKYNYLLDKTGEYPLEICTWCGWYCSYCDIRSIAGFVQSIPTEIILRKIKRWLWLWYTIFHFIDEDSASYGLDIWKNFAQLLNEINAIEWNFRLKIFYFEPGRLERLFHTIDPAIWNRIINFCVPLQTMSQRILKLMNRSYNIPNVLSITQEIKRINPNIIITTQFIYWFPSETFDEFKTYFQVINYFDEVWFWYYSDRKWTQSPFFMGKIPKEEMIRRLVFLWKMKEHFLTKIFDKNETLHQGIHIFQKRDI